MTVILLRNPPCSRGWRSHFLPKLPRRARLRIPAPHRFRHSVLCGFGGGRLLLLAACCRSRPTVGAHVSARFRRPLAVRAINSDFWLDGSPSSKNRPICVRFENHSVEFPCATAPPEVIVADCRSLRGMRCDVADDSLRAFRADPLGRCCANWTRAFWMPFSSGGTWRRTASLCSTLFWLFGTPESYIIFPACRRLYIQPILARMARTTLLGYGLGSGGGGLAGALLSFSIGSTMMFAKRHLSPTWRWRFLFAASNAVAGRWAIRLFAWLAAIMEGAPAMSTCRLLVDVGFYSPKTFVPSAGLDPA